MTPPKPPPRADRVSLWAYFRAFRRDILSAQPARLYGAWMAEFKTPFFRSYLVNQPDLVRTILRDRPMAFPKSDRVGEGLRPLLGDSVFLTNGAVWQRQRRMIDPAFEGGRLRDTFPSMVAAAQDCVARMGRGGRIEVEELASHVTADIIFRTLFSIPITDTIAAQVFQEFRAYQRSAPILNLAALVPLPGWIPRPHRRETLRAARRIRALLTDLTDRRRAEIAAGTAPDDLATKILTTRDPATGQTFDTAEMVDQVAIFFLAGHETSAAALGWTLYLLATHPDVQTRVAAEAETLETQIFSDLSRLPFTRDVFREALRLYPPVPMMVRETTQPESFRNRILPKRAQIVLSPWHLHRHTRLWDAPDDFDPDRWQTAAGRDAQKQAFIPFSAGPRVCTGAGFAMAEGVLLTALLTRAFDWHAMDPPPIPIAHLTVRSRDGIWLTATPR